MAHEGGNFWSRIKQNTSSLTANISSLSIGNDTDGKTEYDTLVHKALVNFYMEKAGGNVPDWLVEDDPTFNESADNFTHTNLPNNKRFYPVGMNNSAAAGGGELQHGYHPSSASSSHSQSQYGGYGGRPVQSARTQTPASASLHDMYRSSRTSGSSSSTGNSNGSSGSVPNNRPATTNSIRDRLKNGQRANYGTTSSATANRLQSSWAKR